MKLYPKYPTAISCMAFSPDGTKLAIGASYEHDNAVAEAERGTIMLLIKVSVMTDCKVSASPVAKKSGDEMMTTSTAKIKSIDICAESEKSDDAL